MILLLAAALAQEPPPQEEGPGDLPTEGVAPAQEGVVPAPEGGGLTPIPDLTRSLSESTSWCSGKTRLLPTEAGWCDDVPEDCPGMRDACADLADQEERLANGGCQGSEQTASTPDLPQLVSPPDLSWLPQVLGAVAIGIAAILILHGIWAWLRELRAVPALPPPEPTPSPVGAPEPLPFDPAGDLVAQARAALDEGRLAAALLILRHAALATLTARGLVTPHPSRTDREYLRGLSGDAARDLRDVLTPLEASRYAALPTTRADVERALAAVARLGAGALVLLAILGGGRALAGPADHDLLVKWLGARGFLADTGRFPEGSWLDDDTSGVLYLWPMDSGADDDTLARALATAADGGIVVAVGRVALDLPEPDLERGPMSEAKRARVADEVSLGTPMDPVIAPFGLAPFTPPEGAGVLARAADAEAGVVGATWAVGEGRLVVLAIPGLLDDASLLHAANAAFLDQVLALEEPYEVKVIRDRDAAGYGGSPMAAVRAAGLLPAIGHGLVAVLLAAWAFGRRFAAPLDPPEARRRDFTEHLRAAGHLYRDAAASRQALAAYARWALLRLRERTRATDAALVSAVAVRTGRDPDDVARVLDAARDAVARPDDGQTPADDRSSMLRLSPGSPARDLALQEELWQILNSPARPKDGS